VHIYIGESIKILKLPNICKRENSYGKLTVIDCN
jgi:hypothetical protein